MTYQLFQQLILEKNKKSRSFKNNNDLVRTEKYKNEELVDYIKYNKDDVLNKSNNDEYRNTNKSLPVISRHPNSKIQKNGQNDNGYSWIIDQISYLNQENPQVSEPVKKISRSFYKYMNNLLIDNPIQSPDTIITQVINP